MVRKGLFVIVAVLAGLLFWTGPSVAAERIVRFDVEGEIAADGSLTVTEHITVLAQGVEIKRGIIRSIPTDFTDTEGVRRRAGLDLVSALLDGKPTGVDVSRSGENMDFRLGDPDVQLSPGEHLFSVTYKTTGQLGFFTDHDELYWNVTGNDWTFPIDKATFRLKLPGKDFGEGFSAIEFYTGRRGTRGKAATVDVDGTVRSTAGYYVGEGLTVVYSWPKGIVAPPEKPAPSLEWLSPGQAVAVHLGMPVVILAFMLFLWFRWGKDPAPRPIVPLFEPPAGTEAAFARYIRTMTTDDKVFAAMALGLAVKGVLVVEERSAYDEAVKAGGQVLPGGGIAKKFFSRVMGRSYWLKLQRDPLDDDPSLSAEEREFINRLFMGGRSEVSLSVGDRSVLQDAFQTLAKMYKKRGKAYLNTNTGKWAKGVMLYGAYVLAMLIVLVSTSVESFVAVVAFLSGPFLLMPLVMPMPAKKGRLFAWFFRLVFIGLFLLIVGSLALEQGAERSVMEVLPYAGPLISVVVIAVFKPLMRVRTEEGARLNEAVQGLVMYMGTAEKHRMEMLNSPKETPQLFEKLLPYAFALDVAETWANRFEKILADAKYQPDWFRGDLHSFTTGAGIGAFSRGVSSALTSGTRSSGSSGGGSSGGGGGGGGGSGW